MIRMKHPHNNTNYKGASLSGVIALLPISGAVKRASEVICEEAEQLLYWVITTR